MSINAGSIYVKTKPGISQQLIVDKISAYWLKQGAILDKRSPLSIQALTLDNATRKSRLGYAIFPEKNDYIQILDSEVYTADFSLAKYLARSLHTEVYWYCITGADSSALAKSFGTGKKKTAFLKTYDEVLTFLEEKQLPHLFEFDFQSLPKGKKRSQIQMLGFKNVSPQKYDSGPESETSLLPDSEESQRRYQAVSLICNWKQRKQDLKSIDQFLITQGDFLYALHEAYERVECWGDSLQDQSLCQLILQLGKGALTRRTFLEQAKQKEIRVDWWLPRMYLTVLEAAARNQELDTFQLLLKKLEKAEISQQNIGQIYLQKVVDRLKEDKLDSFATKILSDFTLNIDLA